MSEEDQYPQVTKLGVGRFEPPHETLIGLVLRTENPTQLFRGCIDPEQATALIDRLRTELDDIRSELGSPRI